MSVHNSVKTLWKKYRESTDRRSTSAGDCTAHTPNLRSQPEPDQSSMTSPTNTTPSEDPDTYRDGFSDSQPAQRDEQHHMSPTQGRSPIHRKPIPGRGGRASTDTVPDKRLASPDANNDASEDITSESNNRTSHQDLARHSDGTPRPDSPTYVDDFFKLRYETASSERSKEPDLPSTPDERNGFIPAVVGPMPQRLDTSKNGEVSPGEGQTKPDEQTSWYDERVM